MTKKEKLLEIIIPLLAVIAAFLVGGLFILFIGQDPFFIYGKLFSGTLGNFYGVGQVLFKATPLIFTGLAVAFGFRTGLFNIGAQGQLYIGAFLTAYLGVTLAHLPGYCLVPICILGGMLGGAFWAAIPGILKAKRGAHEVITTIMMNFIALALTNYLVVRHFHMPETVHTPAIASSAHLVRFSRFCSWFAGSPLNVSIFLALLTCLVVYHILWKTSLGYELRAVGLNPAAAENGGINIARSTILAMLISGSLAGLAGINYVMGYKYYFEQGFAGAVGFGGLGFMGIAVALLGKNNPIGIVLAALLFGLLSFGGLVINAYVPKELVNILQAIVIFFVIASSKPFRDYFLRLRKRAR
jgi:simple sugar transport system permease protein